MGLLDRIGKIASGLANTLQAPIGLVKDLAVAPFTDDDEFDGFVATIYGHTVNRGGQALESAFSPQKGIGALIGGLPETGVRDPAGAVLRPVLHGLETAGREGIREPLTALMTSASLADAPGGGGLGALITGRHLREGYRIAQDRSLGQSIALAIKTKNIRNDTEVAEAMGTDTYKVISGTMDGLTRLLLDPAILTFQAVNIARVAPAAHAVTRTLEHVPGASTLVDKGIFGRTIRNGDDVKTVLSHPSLAEVNAKIGALKDDIGVSTAATPVERAVATDRAAARIRDLAFPDHAYGEPISRILAEADNLDLVWPALLGDDAARLSLEALAPATEGKISRLVGKQSELAAYRTREGQLPYPLEQAELAMVEAELEALYGVAQRTARAIETWGTVSRVPRISTLSETRSAVTRSDFFQASPYAKPLRLATRMRPHGMVALHEAKGDIQVERFVKKAGLSLEEQDRLRGAYMAAENPTARSAVLAKAEAGALRHLATKHGIPADDVERLVAEAQKRSGSAHAHIAKSHVYDADAKFSVVESIDDAGVVHRINLPGAVTQEFNHYALPNLDAVEASFARFGRTGARAVAGEATDLAARYGTEALDLFYAVWKPSVLIRAGWPIRVVGEEQVRIMSKIGVLATLKNTSTAGVRYGKDLAGDLIAHADEVLHRIPKGERRWADPQSHLLRGQRLGTKNVNGWEIQAAAGMPGDVADVALRQNSAGRSMEAFLGAEKAVLADLRATASGQWKSIAPHELSYGPAWKHAVNNQIGKDAMWRQFVEGKTVDQVDDWIRNTAEGRDYLRRLPHWRNNVDEWLTVAKEVADNYLPTAELRAKALAGEATADDLARAFPNAADRPMVHGEILNEIQGKSIFRKKVEGFRHQAMDKLGRLPTDVLSRHPYFDAMYTQEVRRLVELHASQGAEFTPALAARIEKQARAVGVHESKRLLYDLAEQSDLGYTLRYLSPFYSAWQEVLTRWTGIAVENPAFVARMHQVWRSPERAGIVTDEHGNRIHDDGTATDHLGNKVEAGADEYITLPIPKWATNDLTRHIPGVKGLEAMGGVKFSKDGFNTILTGAPGVGPLVQIPVNEIVKSRPELESAMKFILPFGTTQETMDLLLPATAKRIKTRSAGEEDRVYRNTLIRIYYDGITDHNLGKRTSRPTYAEAKKKTDAFYSMRTIASWTLPVAPQFFSPYQTQIDIYRNLKEADQGKDRTAPGYRTPDEIFLEDFGPEYFALTQSLSKTMDGVPPTLEGNAARKKYQDLIEAHPELGNLIIGAEGAGEFSRAVYDSQLQSRVAPGSEDFQRESSSFEEAAAAPEVRLGWIEYQKYMDLIDAELHQRGLPNYRVKAAADLASMKRQVTTKLAEKHPAWFAEFSIVDREAMNRRLTGMREIAADEKLRGRPDISGLADYLRYRDLIEAELRARDAAGGAKTIDAVENADLDGMWEQIKTKLLERNLAFSSLYYRWLYNDRIAA